MQPLATYSSTFATTSSGSPDAVQRWTMSSGTRRLAAATHDEVAAASRLVPDDIVQRCTASGTPDEVVAKVDEYVASGCTCPILYPLGPDVGLMLDTFARA